LKLYKDEQFLIETGMEFRVAAVAECTPTKISRHVVHWEVVGLMNVELVMGGILEGDCKDRMADRLLRSYR